jgi:uncharacterized protein with von Willebrand factor type A (vWA) domain
MNLNYHVYEKQIRILAKKQGLGVKYIDEWKAFTDGRSIYVPRPNPEWDDAKFHQWQYMIYHEMGHNDTIGRGSLERVVKVVKAFGFAKYGFNILDDTTQEQVQINRGYEGMTRIIQEGAHNWKKKDVVHVTRNTVGMSEEEVQQQAAFDALWVWDMGLRSSGYALGHIRQQAYDGLNDKTKEYVDALDAGDYKDCYHDIVFDETWDGWWELWELLKRMNREVFKLDEKENGFDEEENKKRHDEGGEGDEEGEGNEDGEEGEEGEGSGKKKKKGKRSREARVKYKDLLYHDHSESDDGRSKYSLTIEYEADDIMGGGKFNVTTPKVFYDESARADYDCTIVDGYSRALANNLRRILQAKSQARVEHGKKSGKICNRNVYRASLKDGGGIEQKIFKRKEVNITLNAAVQLIGDGSGSMGGAKFQHMGQGMLLLNQALTQLRVNHEMFIFSHGSQCLHTMVKKFGEHLPRDKILQRINAASYRMYNNADGESILWGYNRIIMQPNPRKVMIVLSDGQPAAHGGNIASFTYDVIKNIEKEGKVTIYGIGIMDETVKEFYKNYTVIYDSDELEHRMLDIVKKYLINE